MEFEEKFISQKVECTFFLIPKLYPYFLLIKQMLGFNIKSLTEIPVKLLSGLLFKLGARYWLGAPDL